MGEQDSKDVFPVSKVCPKCGGVEYTTRKAKKFVAFVNDRVCKACNTRYTPPTPPWAGFVFILIGLPLAAIGVYSVYLRLASGNPLGIPAMACEGIIGFLGLMSVGLGIRALVRPGKA